MEWITVVLGILTGVAGAFVVWATAGQARDDRQRERVLLRSIKGPGFEVWFPPREDDESAPSTGTGKDDQLYALAEHLQKLERRLDDLSPALPTSSDEQERLDFDRLWDGAQARLAKYHELAVIQGRQSFRMLLLFSALGFGLLAFVVWRATEVDSTAGGVALGAASTAGAALTGYIGRTFMRAYREANARLIDYFAEPLDMSRLLAAERLLARVGDQTRDEAALRIIDGALLRKAATDAGPTEHILDHDLNRTVTGETPG